MCTLNVCIFWYISYTLKKSLKIWGLLSVTEIQMENKALGVDDFRHRTRSSSHCGDIQKRNNIWRTQVVENKEKNVWKVVVDLLRLCLKQKDLECSNLGSLYTQLDTRNLIGQRHFWSMLLFTVGNICLCHFLQKSQHWTWYICNRVGR